jgi:hypothetical protein
MHRRIKHVIFLQSFAFQIMIFFSGKHLKLEVYFCGQYLTNLFFEMIYLVIIPANGNVNGIV